MLSHQPVYTFMIYRQTVFDFHRVSGHGKLAKNGFTLFNHFQQRR